MAMCKHESLQDVPVRVELAARVVGQKSERRHVDVTGPLDVLRGVHDLWTYGWHADQHDGQWKITHE